MHCTTKALVLRGVDYKESDRILTLLTQDMGKVTVSARGCGKFRLTAVGGLSKKGRTAITIKRYG